MSPKSAPLRRPGQVRPEQGRSSTVGRSNKPSTATNAQFGRTRRTRDEPAPAPAKSSTISSGMAFALVAICFGVGVLGLWRLNSPEDQQLSVLAVIGILAIFLGGYQAANETGVIDAITGGSDSGGDGGGDGGGD